MFLLVYSLHNKSIWHPSEPPSTFWMPRRKFECQHVFITDAFIKFSIYIGQARTQEFFFGGAKTFETADIK